jgi:hypothetical protein
MVPRDAGRMQHMPHRLHRRGSGRSGGFGFMDLVKGATKVLPLAKMAYDTFGNVIPPKYKQYTDIGRQLAGSAKPPRAKRQPSRYNLLVSSVVKDKFAGQPDALSKASAYIKENNLFHGGHYVPGSTTAAAASGAGRSGGRVVGGRKRSGRY